MSMGASPPGGGMEEYQRLVAERAAAAKRKRTIYAVVVVVALVAVGVYLQQDKKKKAAGQAVLDAAARFADRDKMEMGAFWSCAFGTDVDIGLLSSGTQIQQKIEAAYATQQKTFSEHLTTECVPKLESARAAFAGLGNDMPAELKPPLERYVAAIPRMQTGLEVYAEKIKGRGAVKDVDQAIQEVGGAFSLEATPESIAFEKFLVCAVPDLDKKKDVQGLLQGLFETCKKGDPVAFMTHVREACGPIVQNVDKSAKPSKTFKANTKKFYEEDARQLRAWEDCGRWSRKGKKVLDLEDFLNAAGDYVVARAEVVQTARETNAQILGHPLPAPTKKAGEAE